ncbi:hypothetical protein [Streptomyces flavofungini]|uniref:Uncharacterized protein n=1 Tax=Streptomyces flavofungini TaxID=68200 RepID=A0ABS0WYT9_9ACTN|nr:hypothetical protein [Streptomyces flavofungini]MBJ3806100.1 hypothetical protein [Streptomyces flavofungini]GHC47378.1 hypothetical protein GCM10010349_10690 [Streptomyces flavofungini]
MGSDGRRSGPRPQSDPVCKHCGRPVGTAIKRRKVLGAYVPVWAPAPCHNPECDACVADEPDEKSRAGRGYKSKHKPGHLPRHAPEAGTKAAAEPAPEIDLESGATATAPQAVPEVASRTGAQAEPKPRPEPDPP